jgi:hypothetical protein
MKLVSFRVLLFLLVAIEVNAGSLKKKNNDSIPDLEALRISLLEKYYRGDTINYYSGLNYDSIFFEITKPQIIQSAQSRIATLTTTGTQNSLLSPPVLIPPTPENAALSRINDIPVSEYSGVPEISIPVYTLKTGDYELPINLSYHASGIKVSQEATWVGLGWNLNPGGAITLNPVGNIDQKSYSGAPWSDWEKMQAWNFTSNYYNPRRGIEDGYHGWGCWTGYDISTSKTPALMIKQGQEGAGEQDVYEVTLPNGKSFKYILHPRDKTPLMIGDVTNCKIYHSGTFIMIMDSDGTEYRFSNGMQFEGVSMDYNLSYISTIAKDTIYFTYTQIEQRPLPTLSETYIVNPIPGVPSSSREINSFGSNYKYCLTKIESSTEEILFTLGSRADTYPGNSGKLEKITIKNKLSNKVILSYQFNYDYFNGNTTGGNFLSSSDYFGGVRGFSYFTDEILSKRLKLLSIIKKDRSNVNGETFSFTYNENEPLPYKTSFSSDFWGYYNGANNSSPLMNYSHTLIPNLASMRLGSAQTIGSVPYDIASEGAVRNSSETYITAGTIKSIKYPTGGSVEYEFELHRFDNYKIPDKENASSFNDGRTINTVNNNNPSFSHPNEFFYIPFDQYVEMTTTVRFDDFTAYDMRGSGSIIVSCDNGKNMKTMVISAEDYASPNPITMYNKKEVFLLPKGNYVMASSISSIVTNQGYSARNVSAAQLRYKVNVDTNALTSYAGGGIRVRKITKKDENNNVKSTTLYLYNKTDGSTSGKLLSPLDWVRRKFIRYGHDDHPVHTKTDYETFRIQSQSITPPSSLGCSYTVGYDRVVKKIIDGNNHLGYEISEFSNIEAIKWFDNFMFFPSNFNGSLVTKTILNADSVKRKKIVNNYSIDNERKEMINILAEDNYVGPTDHCCGNFDDAIQYNPYIYNGRYVITMYPSTSYKINLNKQTETIYENGDSLISESSFKYNPYYLLNEKIVNTSDPTKTIQETFTYSTDYYPSGAYAAMHLRNMVSPVITHTRTKANSFLRLTNTYSLINNVPAITSAKEETDKELNKNYSYKYDKEMNPVEVTLQNTESTVYLWGYNYSYIIAAIKNIKYDTLVSRVGATQIDQLCSASTPSISILEQLRTILSDCEVTTWLHDPSIGIVQKTDPNGLNTYFEYDSFNRLQYVRNHNREIVNKNEYHYSTSN